MVNKFFYMNYSRFNYDSHILSLIHIKKILIYLKFFNKIFKFVGFSRILLKNLMFNLKYLINFKDNLKYDKIINIKNYKFLIFNFVYLFKTNLDKYFYHIFYLHNYKTQQIFVEFYNYVNKICDKNTYLNWFKYSKLLIYLKLLSNWFYQTNIHKINNQFKLSHIYSLNKFKNKLKYNILLSFFKKYKKKNLYNNLKKLYNFKYLYTLKKINQFPFKFYLKNNTKFSKYSILKRKRFKKYFGFKGLKLKIERFYVKKFSPISNLFIFSNWRNDFSVFIINNKHFYNLCLMIKFILNKRKCLN
jgi:hypothetical protein